MILDRQVDLATPLHHTWTYQALAHDVLQYSLNRVSITEGDQGKMLNVHFCQKVLMFLSYLQTEEYFTFLNLKI